MGIALAFITKARVTVPPVDLKPLRVARLPCCEPVSALLELTVISVDHRDEPRVIRSLDLPDELTRAFAVQPALTKEIIRLAIR
jgi:hypothetical protein